MARITCLHGHEIELQPDQMGERIACPACQLLIFISPPRAGEPVVPKYEVLCDNGHVLRVKSKYLGTQIRCPQCQGLAWVTTDKLQRHKSVAVQPVVAPVVPAKTAQPVAVRRPTPVTAPADLPVAVSLDDIPVAVVDKTASIKKPASRFASDDDEESDSDDIELTKAERRNMKLADQGLSFFTGSVIGYLGIQMVAIVLSFLMFLISQGVSTMEGFRTLGSISDVIGWIIFIALILNILFNLASQALIQFTPWITGATIWFLLGLVLTLGFVGWRIFLIVKSDNWRFAGEFAITGNSIGDGKLYYFIGEALFLLMWLAMIVGLWALGKFARKPMTRQRVMLLGMMGFGCCLVMSLFPLLYDLITPTKGAIWVVFIFRVLLTIGIGTLLIFQHLNVVGDVRAVMARRK